MRNFAIEMKWAVIFTVVFLIWMMAEKTAGLHDTYISQSYYAYFFAIPAIIIYFMSISEKKKQYFKQKMSWQQGFISGILLSLFIAVLSPIAQYISYTFISPHFFTHMIEYQVERNAMTETFAAANFNLSSSMKRAVSDALSMGILTSAIVAFFVKTKNPVS